MTLLHSRLDSELGGLWLLLSLITAIDYRYGRSRRCCSFR